MQREITARRTMMLRVTELKLPLEHGADDLVAALMARLRLLPEELLGFTVFRRACDARRGQISFTYSLDVTVANEAAVRERLRDDPRVTLTPDMRYRFVTQARADEKRRPVIVGTGPCGIFAGLVLAQMGFRPILLERGKRVRERAQDTWALWRQGLLDPESNVQFGEGGAGTFSDGKLHSQVRDPRHLGRKVLEEFVKAGAPEEILFLNKPHIGTFRLVKMVETLRETLLALGAEIRFESRVEEILLAPGHEEDGRRRIRGVRLRDGEILESAFVMLAIGHSARDTFQMLFEAGVEIAAKPFSIGVRIEHPQRLIDAARFGKHAGHPLLGAADYRLVHHARNDRTVYSFCMCPGGQVVAATSEPFRVVTNGMSQYSRAERNANSGMVVDVEPGRDFPADALAGIAFQRHWESRAFEAGGGFYKAPAQLVGDFLAGRPSTRLGSVLPSYQPGIHLTDLTLCLPGFVVAALKEALPAFGRQIRGYDMADALMTGVETRTSSPLRLPRDPKTFESARIRGLYPAGEGAGYAGGILSAAMDGIKTAEALALQMNATN
jgi:uncharacterized FAD-dependent dehydrogenase